eukprot:2884553-Prymnesium_polylepis.1
MNSSAAAGRRRERRAAQQHRFGGHRSNRAQTRPDALHQADEYLDGPPHRPRSPRARLMARCAQQRRR